MIPKISFFLYSQHLHQAVVRPLVTLLFPLQSQRHLQLLSPHQAPLHIQAQMSAPLMPLSPLQSSEDLLIRVFNLTKPLNLASLIRQCSTLRIIALLVEPSHPLLGVSPIVVLLVMALCAAPHTTPLEIHPGMDR